MLYPKRQRISGKEQLAFLQLSLDLGCEGYLVQEHLWWQGGYHLPPSKALHLLCSSCCSQRDVTMQHPDPPGQPIWLEGGGLWSLPAPSVELLIHSVHLQKAVP